MDWLELQTHEMLTEFDISPSYDIDNSLYVSTEEYLEMQLHNAGVEFFITDNGGWLIPKTARI